MEDMVFQYLGRCRVLFKHSRDPYGLALEWLSRMRKQALDDIPESATPEAVARSEAARHYNAINAAIASVTFEMMLRDLPTKQPTKGAG